MEIWKDIIGYEGYYQVSNLGNVKCLERRVVKRNGFRLIKEKKKALIKNSRGYIVCRLSKEGINITRPVHLLVAEAFLNHKSDRSGKIVVDHIDNNKNNNTVSNLQIITHRENNTKDRKNKSGYTGVSNYGKKWRATCQKQNKFYHLGMFNCPTAAYFTYLKFIKDESVI